MSEHQQRFQALLRELFQFDSADLDFGIYRIMNHKRGVIERYIAEDLPRTIAAELSLEALAEQAAIGKQLEEAREKVIEVLGRPALDSDGNLQQDFHDTPVGGQYVSLQQRQEQHVARGADPDALQATVYNHLYNFFSRYYDDGDFISKRRYSRRQRYAIPYNGEEVHLHWANKDQYYVKTSQDFRDYAFKAGDINVHFVVVDADVEQGNLKGAKRYFFPRLKEAAWNKDNRDLHIPFEFRPPTAADTEEHGNKRLQEAIIENAVADLSQELARVPATALKAERRRKGEPPVTTFEHHMRRFTRRNTTDFFIHKDLKGFLSRELDFYLKNEVLNIDGVETNDEITADRWRRGWFQTLRLMRTAAGEVIDFLDQSESFQKMIWEKRKFVTDVQYCLYVGNTSESLYEAIAMCDDQWTEWRTDFGFEVDIEGTSPGQDVHASRIAALKSHPTLVLDTKHFSSDFKDSLLASIDDLSQGPTGLLLHSDNWQALNFLATTQENAIDCIYIDPPYNTSASEIIYKNGYRQSSWMTLMANRVSLASRLLKSDAAWVVAIDDTEMPALSQVIESVCPGFDRNVVVVNHHPAGSGLEGSNVSSTHEYALFFTPEGRKVLRGALKDDSTSEIGFIRTGTEVSNLRKGRPNSFYAVLVDRSESKVVGVEAPPEGDKYPREDTEEGFARIYPVGSNGVERVWRRSYRTVRQCIDRGEIICKNGRSLYLSTHKAGRRSPVFSNWTDSRFNAGVHGSNLLTDLFGSPNAFSYPKSLHTVRDCIDACTHHVQGAVVLDYFAGSGTTAHATMMLNREDGGNRSFVLVEMGDYFRTVTLPRVKKVMFAPEWKAGRPEHVLDGEEMLKLPRIVKYMRLESYEDALANVEFDDADVQRGMELEDYVIKYMLNWETRNSATLLNVEQLSRPFDYKLATHANGNGGTERADVAETFNYLLGLRARTRKVCYDGGRKYLVYRGMADGRETVVVWRETEGWKPKDYRRDQRFLTAQNLVEGADVVYANGVCFLSGAKALDPLFKERMFAPPL